MRKEDVVVLGWSSRVVVVVVRWRMNGFRRGRSQDPERILGDDCYDMRTGKGPKSLETHVSISGGCFRTGFLLMKDFEN